MFELMYDAKGVGLAANQVDLPFRLFVTNLAGAPDEGEEMVFINPVVERPKGNTEQDEGCLSLPEVYAPVRRPERITVSAYDLSGNEINGEIDGIMARVVQHETDHLDAVDECEVDVIVAQARGRDLSGYLPLACLRRGVADAVAFLHAAFSADRAGGEQQAFEQGRLAAQRRTDDRYRALVTHVSSQLAAPGTPSVICRLDPGLLPRPAPMMPYLPKPNENASPGGRWVPGNFCQLSGIVRIFASVAPVAIWRGASVEEWRGQAMTIWGKIIGGTAGFALGGPLGARHSRGRPS